MKFLLASSSPRRKELLTLLDIDFTIRVPIVNEKRKDGEAIESFIKRVAMSKGEAVYTDNLFNIPVISVDTVVVCDNSLIGKPATRSEAYQFLNFLSGKVHEVLSGLSIKFQGFTSYDLARTKVEFDILMESEINHYLDSEDYLDKAGAYAIQGKASVFVKKIDGCFFNVMGFPLNLFHSMLKKIGLNIWE